MHSGDIITYSVRNMKRRQLRSWLTIIGIIIGIATIVVLVSVGEGVKKDINDQLEAFGSDMVMVMPYSMEDVSGFGPGLTSSGRLFERDISYIERVPGIKDISKGVFGRVALRFRDKEISSPVYAVTPNTFDMYESQYEIEEGRYIQDGERHVAFLMNDAANELFGKDKVKVNSYLYIGGSKYRVVGIAKKIGTSMSEADDSAIYVPYLDRDELFGDTLAEDELSYVFIQLDKGVDTDEASERIEEQLASSHRVSTDEADFTLMTSESVKEMVNQVTDILTGSLFLIGLISAVVGGIGIANTMFMSVVERTKEIGILKSIGASSWQILALFLTEAGLIGGVGGLIGLGLGMILMAPIPYLGIIPYLAPEVAAGVVVFAMVVGLAAGFVPARNASSIPAIEALRYD